MELLEFLLHIKRFPSVEIWIDEKERYHALCCPSFEHCEGIKSSLEDALIDLVEQLEGYFSNEEKNDLEELFQGDNVGNMGELPSWLKKVPIKSPLNGSEVDEELENELLDFEDEL